ncbi:MAG TPA: CoB--CoM heterodisulfide reductase iron-sulfur subunit A family protein [Candidatus Paceibacterota bacterium]|nr:CoB--CoM heterodisulfide reductase iron-sulfur subunit A family protein [Verrucomicrobiota bacterium]HRY49686.1 CoB--CoM heterodisulfide reductase iron-sulfur subunit A family protein [Candidatus Paceibacterota bacterium]HSA01944.1 CoB--CoM heterodisulfide reductase iron-sulfur subunit A family protein [Candidatus Paceibacterota bacterium]
MLPKRQDPIRIGFYVCHCGVNIASMIDVEAVARYAQKLPNVVVSRHYKYMCSDPGQELIQEDIAEHRLNRIVVAACSPLLHEHTFRSATKKGGLNPFFFQMVNIREHNSWVHTSRADATRKAMAQVRAAINRVPLHKPLEVKKVPINPNVLIVGGGIAGIHAALVLANAGKQVYLVEREATIGGHMAKFDKTFPTLDCAMCVLSPKMAAVGNHPNITLWTYSEVTKVDGYVGNYKVAVRRKPRYIIEDLCTGCQECVASCVYREPKFPDEFNLKFSKRKPVFLPFPQAVPPIVMIDPETCIETKTGKCKKTCVEACGDRKAIDFKQTAEIKEIQVGTIIVATGFKTFEPSQSPYYSFYGHGIYPQVYTSLEIERLVNASGPTGGEIILRNGKIPKKVAIIHCIGSRDVNTNHWCSRVCCLYSLKLAHLIHERTEAQIINFYIDMRTPGKMMEEFYDRISEEGVMMIRGKVADVYPDTSNGDSERLIVQAEDTLMSRVLKIPVDMVVLSVGMEPNPDSDEVRRKFNMSCSSEGWFLERHPKLAPVSTFTDGIFVAGCCQGPKDIPDSVAQAGAAAAEAFSLIDKGTMEQEPNTAFILEDECSGCKSCLPLCPYTAILFDPVKEKAFINEALCKGCGTCVGSCPSGSIKQNLFEDEEIFCEIDGLLASVEMPAEEPAIKA